MSSKCPFWTNMSERRGIVLVVGEKSDGSKRRFCHALIRKADERFDRHLALLADEGGS